MLRSRTHLNGQTVPSGQPDHQQDRPVSHRTPSSPGLAGFEAEPSERETADLGHSTCRNDPPSDRPSTNAPSDPQVGYSSRPIDTMTAHEILDHFMMFPTDVEGISRGAMARAEGRNRVEIVVQLCNGRSSAGASSRRRPTFLITLLVLWVFLQVMYLRWIVPMLGKLMSAV